MEPTARSLAHTYAHQSYANSWNAVKDYRRVQQYAADHPNAGRVKVGNALELPPSRVRGWLNDSQPDAVRGIHTAVDHGWLNPDPENETAATLVHLAAHVFAGGSINNKWVPRVTPNSRVAIADLKALFARTGIDTTVRRTDEANRTTEVVPRSGASVLGRCLTCMGVPRGVTKYATDSVPHIVHEITDELRRKFVQIFLQHRMIEYEGKETIRVTTDRSQGYFTELAQLIRDVTDERVTVDSSGVTVSAAAVRSLNLA